jgi:hypothetical protein
MASYVSPGNSGGNAGSQELEPEEPIPGWRKPIALVGWSVLIAVLIGLIIWGDIQLAQGHPPPASVTTTSPPTTTPPTTTTPTSGTDTGTPTNNSPAQGAFPHLPSVITVPSLPGLPTEITLPPGL